ncbi:two-component system response regulator [Streptococcus bovimastitidis]|uniref:Transcriptional regulatory protein n=1 Tax=Streptococcus bovimastitidis TaxID=1856638 RepID=A0A1L8MPE8_9STRE|nr:response regulator [Streptococcus bovimastitidis]OJF72555.1 two-component system response regulator [Streptococcus bovimastitidis]
MNVLIIEDDPMVDFIHRNYLEKIGHFNRILSSDSIQDAKAKLDEFPIHLILLDIHIKDGNGLTLLEFIRNHHVNCEVIIISAANDGKIIKSGFHLGIIDYLIKPFTYDRFEVSIKRFLDHQKQLNQSVINQEAIDALRKSITVQQYETENSDNQLLDKGLSQATYQLITESIAKLPNPFTIQDVSEISSLSHVSVRKYIAYLEENKQLVSELIYTKVGRPYRVYRSLEIK